MESISATECESLSLHEPFVQILKSRMVKHAAGYSVKYALSHNELPNLLGIRGSHECEWKECEADKGTKSSTVGEPLAEE